MLKKVNRIGTKKEFAEIKEKGKLYQTPLFGFLILKNQKSQTPNNKPQFGFIISKKISKKAVERNRIRRLLAEAVRKNLDGFAEGTRIVFLVKTTILGKSLRKIEEEVKKMIYEV